MLRKSMVLVVLGMLVLALAAPLHAQDDLKAQIDAVKGALPKFAIPMREVGDRFQNIYFAAKEGNWALAAYMSKYMNNAMNPAKVTKPKEYPDWASFYTDTFDKVNKAIAAEDFQAFEKEYDAVIRHCNDCHDGMGYGFINVIRMKTPADQGIDYTIKSKAADVPK